MLVQVILNALLFSEIRDYIQVCAGARLKPPHQTLVFI